MKLLSNGEIYQLSRTMTIDDLVEKVHETQPGLSKSEILGIIKAIKKSIRLTQTIAEHPAQAGESACNHLMGDADGIAVCWNCGKPFPATGEKPSQ
jgi:hypothetical protein